MRRWPRPLRLLVKGILSVVVLVGYPALAVNIGGAAYDMVALDGCAKGYLQIREDYEVASKNTPVTGDPKVMAAYIADTEKVLIDRVTALICPRSISDEKERFIAARRAYRTLLLSVVRYGIPKDEYAQSIFWQQYEYTGTRAGVAAQELTAAIQAEWDLQHPPKAQS